MYQLMIYYEFYTLTKLQGSQTMMEGNINNVTFYTLTKLQGSQTQSGSLGGSGEFYTLTKLQGSQTQHFPSRLHPLVLHSYKITRFSNVH